jgi:sulfoxide reductase heme-binding subunit YedZ
MFTNKLFRTILFTPAFYWIWLVFTDNLGADPAKHLNHLTGRMALYYILANFAVGILVAFRWRWPAPLRFLPQERRWLGVISFLFLICHVVFYFLLEGFEPKAWTQIVTKTYLILGSLAWLILFVLALTSNNFSVKRLGGKKWKKLHRAIYLAAALFTVHILLIEKADLIKYGIIFSVFWALQLARHLRGQSQPQSSR